MLAVGRMSEHRPRRWVRELPWVLVIAAVVTLVWAFSYNRWSASAWRTPVTYGGDAWSAMAFVKALATGEILPILPKYPHSLGAPFYANWNDFPSVEEGIFTWWALLAWLFGLSAGSSLVLFSTHLLAALSFYGTCRRLRYDRSLSAATAVLFSFAPFAFYRNLQHLPLTYYWHIPLGILVVWLCSARRAYPQNRRSVIACLIVAVLHGFQNPYYTGMFLQLLGFAALWQLARSRTWRAAVMPVATAVVTLLTFVVANIDTLYVRGQLGTNHGAVLRSYQNLEYYALKPVEFLLPISHRVDAIEGWTRNVYLPNTFFHSEVGSPYLGWIAIVGLLWMLWRGFLGLATRDPKVIPAHLFAVAWIVAYSIVGGINGVVGFFVQYFRGTNRYSIFVLCFVLLFVTRELSRLTCRRSKLLRGAVAAAVLVVGLLDQIAGVYPLSLVKETARQISSDRRIVAKVESALPSGAMLFQLPVRDFPEGGAIEQMGDHEHFRPYLYSEALRFSYGNHKGRTRDRWQKELEGAGAARMIEELERYGFAAVWINRKGYADRGAALLAAFRAAGRGEMIAKADDFYCLRLNPAAHPVMPPEFELPWSYIEGHPDDNWRWTAGPANLILYNSHHSVRRVHVSFGLATLQPRNVQVIGQEGLLAECAFEATNLFCTAEFTVTLQPGANRLRFETDRPGAVAGNGDPRVLAFRLVNFRLRY